MSTKNKKTVKQAAEYDPYGPAWRAGLLRMSKKDLVKLLAEQMEKAHQPAAPSMAERMVRVRHIASGRYLVVEESCRVYSQDDPAPEYKLSWGPVQVAASLLESTARAVAAAWICLADDSSVEIEEVEA